MENEKRLIDANALEELENLDYVYNPVRDGCAWYRAADVWACIDREPTVDAVEVVRCKDCKHKTVTSDGMVCECALPTKTMKDYYIYGSTILARVKPDDYCSHGERREGE